VALGKQKHYEAARTALTKAASYASNNSELSSLADRAHMAIAYLEEEQKNIADTYLEIQKVSTSGVFSNRALLSSGWASVNTGDFARALPPLTLLQGRSMAIPEVQEAVLLVPHVYERLGLMGRSAEGFIKAYARYDTALEDLEQAERALGDADVLELFVENVDDLLGESDWFGISPTVSLNALSPYLIELMSDHSFQSVLKDLRDLYAIRHNLDDWLEKRDDFKVMIEAREASRAASTESEQVAAYVESHESLSRSYASARQRVAHLDDEDQKKVTWMLDDVAYELKSAQSMLSQLSSVKVKAPSVQGYAELVEGNMRDVERELQNTNDLIDAVEGVLRKLVKAELNVHRQRLKYYRIQSHLAKVRILDRSLSELDANEEVEIPGPAIDRELVDPAQDRNVQNGAGDDAA
jgi:tetratricopeptide (TPR) repeat protein